MGHGTFIKLQIALLNVIIIFSFSGCDQINALKESFSENFGSKDKSQQAAAPSTSTPSSSPQKVVDKPLAPNELARVGDWAITIEQFNERLAQLKEVVPEYDITDLQSRALILEELIRQQLLVAYAEESGLARREDIRGAVDEFRRTLLVREVAVSLTQGVEATDLEAQEYYDQNKEVLVDPPQYHVREIVANTQQGAKDILIELLKGMDFAQTARERSIGSTASQGGDLGFIDQPPFEQMASALATLSPGDISNVFSGPEGFYIIKLEEVSGGEPKEFSELKDEIKTGLSLLKQQQAILKKIEEVQQKVRVKVNEALLSE